MPTTVSCLAWPAKYGLLQNSYDCQHQNVNSLNRYSLVSPGKGSMQRWSHLEMSGMSGKKSVREDFFLFNSNLPLKKILELLVMWCGDARQYNAQKELNISSHKVVDWYNFVRDVCGLWVADNCGPIGGIDEENNSIEVQIDESKFMHRNYHCGLCRNCNWVFGGIETRSNKYFLDPCPENCRDAATLLHLIQQWVLPGSRIVSGMWAAYGGIPNLPQGYSHETVNHSEHFVDPVTGVHTQKVKRMWSNAKRKLRAMSRTFSELFEFYLIEFQFKQKHKDNLSSALLYNIRFYPVHVFCGNYSA